MCQNPFKKPTIDIPDVPAAPVVEYEDERQLAPETAGRTSALSQAANKRKGKDAFRIDLNAIQTAGSDTSSGLNLPKV